MAGFRRLHRKDARRPHRPQSAHWRGRAGGRESRTVLQGGQGIARARKPRQVGLKLPGDEALKPSLFVLLSPSTAPGTELTMRFLIAIPLLLVVVLFALSNTQNVHLGLWPLPADFAVDAPLSIIVLAGMAIAFMLGALELWFTALGARRRARRAEHQVKLLAAQGQGL